MVMRWIQDNIKNFNGDPTKVTIDGHSAGAADVGFHIVSPLAKGKCEYLILGSVLYVCIGYSTIIQL
jgi:para-nitrobenzyl esterase